MSIEQMNLNEQVLNRLSGLEARIEHLEAELDGKTATSTGIQDPVTENKEPKRGPGRPRKS